MQSLSDAGKILYSTGVHSPISKQNEDTEEPG
jgi:hypothetical protein